MKIFDEILKLLEEQGADLTGIADVTILDKDMRGSFNCAISIGVALDPVVIRDIVHGPTPEYYQEYLRVNEKLDSLSSFAAQYLAHEGIPSDHWGATNDRFTGPHQTQLPHKTVATLSGLGWIGKCALLVTPAYGSAIRFTTVLSRTEDAIPDRSISRSRCADCERCVQACPGQAVTGRKWYQGLAREDMFDPDRCRTAARQLALQNTGIEDTFCGICIAVCPYTQSYINV